MSRKPNQRSPQPICLRLVFQRHEVRRLKLNMPSAAGHLGGFPRLENWLVKNIDTATGELTLDAKHEARLRHYIQNYGPGGPNGRVRAACVPAFRRAGIDLLPDWGAP